MRIGREEGDPVPDLVTGGSNLLDGQQQRRGDRDRVQRPRMPSDFGGDRAPDARPPRGSGHGAVAHYDAVQRKTSLTSSPTFFAFAAVWSV